MIDEEKMTELLLEWQKRYDRGEEVSVADLCQDRPDLIPALKERIARLRLRLIGWTGEDMPQEHLPAPISDLVPPEGGLSPGEHDDPQANFGDDEQLLAELLLEWEDRHEQGEDVSAVELCKDRPDLVPALAERIASLRGMAWLNFAEPPSEQSVFSPVPGELLSGRYRCEQKIGEGGHGQVYKAYDTKMNRTVAVKIPRSDFHGLRPDARDAFVGEAFRLAQFTSSGIVQIYDMHQHNGLTLIVSQWIDGVDLAQRLVAGKLPLREAVRIVAEVARHLHDAHQQGFVHRDVKPANILLDRTGRVFVADFGIAIEAGAAGRAGGATGTISYMSPERLAGSAKADVRMDIYALGVVFYELLTNRLPFSGSSIDKLEQAILNGAVDQPEQLRLNLIPPQIRLICQKCMALSPAVRYSSADAVADELKKWLTDPDNLKVDSIGVADSRSTEFGDGVFWISINGIVNELIEKINFENIEEYKHKFLSSLLIDKLSSSVSLDPYSDSTFLHSGDLLKLLGMYDRAIVSYTRVIQLNQNSARAFYGRGLAYLFKDKFYKSVVDLSDAIWIEPSNALAWIFRAVAYEKMGEYGKAIADYTEAIRLDPINDFTWFQRAVAHARMKEYGKAIADYTEYSRLVPDSAVAFGSRGEAHKNIQEYDRAIADFTEAIRLDPKYAFAWKQRGATHARLKEYGKAIADYTEASRLDPDYAVAFLLLVGINDVYAGREWAFDAPFRVGRMPVCGLVLLENESVSRQHATVTVNESGWWVFDMGSTNGTFLNGTPIGAEPAGPLRPGDIVQFAKVASRVAFAFAIARTSSSPPDQ